MISADMKTYFIEDLQDADDSCHSVISMADAWIFNGRLVYAGTTLCNISTIIIRNDYSSSHRIMFYFTHTADDDGVLSNCSDKLQVNDGGVQDKPVVGFEEPIYGSNMTGRVYTTTRNMLTLFIHTDPSVSMDIQATTWAMTFTSFHTGVCLSHEYRCWNNRCIFHSLNCGGHNPCGDQSDCNISYPAIATIALGCACAVGMIGVVVFIISKNMGKSLDSSLDVDSEKRHTRGFAPAANQKNVKSLTALSQ